MYKKYLFSVTVILFCCSATAQSVADRLQQINREAAATAEVKAFYSALDHSPAWVDKTHKASFHILFNHIAACADIGLERNDYSFDLLAEFYSGKTVPDDAEDSANLDISITKAAIAFYRDMAYGNARPSFGYDGLQYVPGGYDIPGIIAGHIRSNSLAAVAGVVCPRIREVDIISRRITWINNILAGSGTAEKRVVSNKVLASNGPLTEKLYRLGILDTEVPTDSLLKEKVKEAQKEFDLLADGVIRTSLMQELNVPLEVRLGNLKKAVNYYRWLYGISKMQPVIVVNIPAAYLKVYHKGEVLLEMRMVVGKRSTPTPALTSRVTEVILYPYWHVPYSIATKELLPAIKRDPGYIDANNYQVLNRAGKIMDPYKINWKSLSAAHFPYIIRQSTGCDNALGLLKLNFYSPFGVYLHDTPGKLSFLLSRRFLSHGCMRMEKPMDMGHFVLQDNHIAIDTLEQKGCIRNQSPVTVPVAVPVPVVVWYNPVGIDKAGRILFFEDVYSKFR